TLSEYLSALPDDFDSADALQHQENAVESAWELTRNDLNKTLPNILNPIQLKLLPGFWGFLMRSKGKTAIRYYG
ncbi:MAG: hypothetical protein ABI035_13220, partial [Gemmatimonadaceae bacterium]